jgi:hypothetical protein
MINPKIPARRAFGSEEVGGSGKHPNMLGRGDGPTVTGTSGHERGHDRSLNAHLRSDKNFPYMPIQTQ